MPNIKPISDLRNYTEVLQDVAVGAPVFLTKNGRGRYAIVDIQDYEKTQAALKLMSELAKGRRSGETEGYLSPEEMRDSVRAMQEISEAAEANGVSDMTLDEINAEISAAREERRKKT